MVRYVGMACSGRCYVTIVGRKRLCLNSLTVSHSLTNVGIDLLGQLKNHTVVASRKLQVAERHQFLTSLGRAQYDPGKPQYVSPTALTEGSDLEFVEKVARSTIQLYNAFLKTL